MAEPTLVPGTWLRVVERGGMFLCDEHATYQREVDRKAGVDAIWYDPSMWHLYEHEGHPEDCEYEHE